MLRHSTAHNSTAQHSTARAVCRWADAVARPVQALLRRTSATAQLCHHRGAALAAAVRRRRPHPPHQLGTRPLVTYGSTLTNCSISCRWQAAGGRRQGQGRRQRGAVQGGRAWLGGWPASKAQPTCRQLGWPGPAALVAGRGRWGLRWSRPGSCAHLLGRVLEHKQGAVHRVASSAGQDQLALLCLQPAHMRVMGGGGGGDVRQSMRQGAAARWSKCARPSCRPHPTFFWAPAMCAALWGPRLSRISGTYLYSSSENVLLGAAEACAARRWHPVRPEACRWASGAPASSQVKALRTTPVPVSRRTEAGMLPGGFEHRQVRSP
jgi:hypothetical protein